MSVTGHNGVDPTVLGRWTKEVLAVHQKLEDQRVENMLVCKSIREPLPDLYEAAKNAGLNSKAFKAHIKVEIAKLKFERACKKAEPSDDDDHEAFEALRAVAEAGDLFDHAVKAHDAQAVDDNRDLRPRHLRETEDARIARENAARLEEGISPLDEDDGLGE
jgi:hypothetical protein